MEPLFGYLIMDRLWWFILPGLILGLYAQFKLQAAYGRYINVPVESGYTGAEAARVILDRAGLTDVPVEHVPGHLTDHYDPMRRALFLSEENYLGRSIAAVGVAAHEAGHALQHQAAYAPLKIRSAIVPLVGFASQATVFLFLGGMFLGLAKMALLGIVIYGIITAFQLVTLPVEYDASHRAKKQLYALGIISPSEQGAVSRVLGAAALTYVAAMVQSLMTLLHFLLIFRNSQDRD